MSLLRRIVFFLCLHETAERVTIRHHTYLGVKRWRDDGSPMRESGPDVLEHRVVCPDCTRQCGVSWFTVEARP